MSTRTVCKFVVLSVMTLIMAGITACSPNKNTAATRNYQAFITRYNVHFNGQEHMNETLAEMESRYEDDFSRILLVHPVEAKADNTLPQPNGSFDRSIEKAQKAIQTRSIKKKPQRRAGQNNNPAYKAWLKREEYNPFLHNSWMLLGKGQYYNGDFMGAASTFFYISRHFSWLPATVTEAKIMQALAYMGMGWNFEAEMLLTRIKPEDLINNNLRYLYNLAMADFYLRSENFEQATPFIIAARDRASGAQRTRLNFLLGQAYERQGMNDLAYQSYSRAGSSPSASYRTKFNARIKQSQVFSGSDIQPEVNALRRMTRYDRNKQYLDQIYYAIGNLYLSRQDTTRAIENYILAAEKSTRNGVEKAISQLVLGGLYFDRRQYELAQPCYAEAVPLLPSSHPGLADIRRRSDVLDELAVYSTNVNLQDSLLRLAAMPEEQRLAVIQRIIEELNRREREEAEAAAREEFRAQNQGEGLSDNSAQNFTINTDNSWYFYNTASKNAGRTEFQRRWGSRRLEDNWRRRNKTTFSVDDFNATTETEDSDTPQDSVPQEPELTQEQTDSIAHTQDPHFPEYYLAQIPMTEEDKATSHQVIQEGLFNMGVILKDKLEDVPASAAQFNRLLTDYPDNIYRLDTYYNMYLMYMREGNPGQAEVYRQLILEQFPESPYGQAMTDPNYLENLRGADERAEALYAQTYQDYMENRNTSVHQALARMTAEMPLSKIMPKFMFLDALAYVTERNPEQFNATLRALLERYPETDITPVASAWLRGMAQGRELMTATENHRGMLWDLRLTNDSTATAEGTAASFELNPESRQFLVFTFDTSEVPGNLLLFEVAKHNFTAFAVKDFDLELMNFGRLGILVVNGFENLDELNLYRRVMADSPEFRLIPGVRPIAISEADFQTLLTQGRSFEEYFRAREEQNYIDAQADILMPEQIETLEEAEMEIESEPEVEIIPEGTETEPEIIEEIEEIIVPEIPDLPVVTPEAPVVPAQTPAPVQPSAPAPAVIPAPAPAPVENGSEGDDPLLNDLP